MATSSHGLSEVLQEKEKIRFDPEEYSLRKRLPRCLPKRRTDIYINMKTNFVAQLKRCQKLLDNGESEIFLHGLGLAVNRAVNIALQLKVKYMDTLQLAVNTSTLDVIDDFEPETDDVEPQMQIRSNSAIHIKVYRVSPFLNAAPKSP